MNADEAWAMAQEWTLATVALTAPEIETLDKMLAAQLWAMEENIGEATQWGVSRSEYERCRAVVEKWRRLNGRG